MRWSREKFYNLLFAVLSAAIMAVGTFTILVHGGWFGWLLYFGGMTLAIAVISNDR